MKGDLIRRAIPLQTDETRTNPPRLGSIANNTKPLIEVPPPAEIGKSLTSLATRIQGPGDTDEAHSPPKRRFTEPPEAVAKVDVPMPPLSRGR